MLTDTRLPSLETIPATRAKSAPTALARFFGRDTIRHAKTMNVLIVRTIDLLFLMRHFENETERGKLLLKLLNSGGGWLKADSTEYKIVQ